MLYNPETERLYVSRDVELDESPVFNEGFVPELQRQLGSERHLHVSSLTQRQIGRIVEKYPNDDPYELFVEAVGELDLPQTQYAHIRRPKAYGPFIRENGQHKYFMTFELDRIGDQRIRNEAQKLLGYFGINGSAYKELSPHVTLFCINDETYANYLVGSLESHLGRPQPITLGRAVVDHSSVSSPFSSKED